MNGLKSFINFRNGKECRRSFIRMSGYKEYLSDDEKKKLQSCLLQMLLDFDDFCNKHELTYMLAYGSALGAYRHNGFIPWDDDIDLMMPRKDYTKLLDIYNNDNIQYKLQSIRTETGYYQTFAKIRKNGTCFVEEPTEGVYENNGVFIDIFPLDFVDNAAKIQTKILLTYMIIVTRALSFRACQKYSKKTLSMINYVLLKVLFGIVLCGRSNEEIIRGMEKRVSKIKSSSYVTTINNPYGYNKGIFPTEMIFPVKTGVFEGYKVKIPGNICAYLEMIYGPNYMELPPEEKRRTHKPIKFDID